ncbi:conjugative transposon protein TraN [Alistipes finegoldii]|uniref:conjugative transposon protein TraN n=1 Tax=Alistipes finegoldii TaxID=214856 RepID=UPI00242D0324|nr:conjugative transposon protein TraN [Alistipes finegoldii]
MKKLIMTFAAAVGLSLGSMAQTNTETKSFDTNQVVAPYDIEVSFNKTVHILFPAAVQYVDLGSNDIIAGRASGAENVVRIKAAVAGFPGETNCSVITADGSFYSFIVRYADEPERLSVEMDDWLRKNPTAEYANDRMFVRLSELGGETPVLVNRIMYSVYKKNASDIKSVGSKQFGIESLLKGVYIHKDLMYFHIAVRNTSNVSYDMDFIRFKIVDKKVAKRTAVQETYVNPVRVYSQQNTVDGKSTVRNVFVFPKMTLPDDKVLTVEIFEKGGGRHQSFNIGNAELVGAKLVDDLKTR